MLRFVLVLLCAPLVWAQSEGFVSLSPKKTLGEHWIREGSAPGTWSVKDGVIVCTGTPNGFLRSKKSYRDFIFRATWRFKKEGWTKAPAEWPNAGFFINAGKINRTWPKSLEVQGHYGEAASLFGVRGGKVTGARRGPIDDDRIPFGEWDHIEIKSIGGDVTIQLNGKKINQGRIVEPSEGNICLQAEGWPVYYKNLEIRELGP